MNRKFRRRQAFTLLELMIVLVILVLLFAMVGPRLLGSQKKADIKAAQTQIGNLEAALELYAVDMRTFPSTEDGLQALLEAPSDERAAAKWDGPYLDDDVLPLDPWDNSYDYEYPPTNNRRDFPDIWSPGPDGEADTDDDIVNWRSGSDEAGEAEGDRGDSNRPGEKAPSAPRSPSGGSGGGSGKGSGGGSGGGSRSGDRS
ncbi:MAG: type II secretion system major pseudopilin GspG [Pirellulaceae bacterium]